MIRLIDAALRADRGEAGSAERGGPADRSHDIERGVAGGEAPLRLRAALGAHYPEDEIAAIRRGDGERGSELEIFVQFLGLVGPSGVLPSHYTEYAITRQRRGDDAYAAFLDLFHHRTLSIFYAAWKKYRLDANFEAGAGEGGDPVSSVIAASFGLYGEHLRDRLGVRDVSLYGYSGRLARRANVQSLAGVLGDALGASVDIRPFIGGWTAIASEDQSAIGAGGAAGWNRLGETAVVGEKFWDVQRKFRIEIGLLSWSDFVALLPGEPKHKRASDLARFAAGPSLEFDFAIRLDRESAPPLRLGERAFRLGWSTWLPSDDQRRRELVAIVPSRS